MFMGLIDVIKIKTFAWLKHSQATLLHRQERQMLMQALTLAKQNRLLPELADFSEVEFSAFSQFGEDGVIDWLVSRLPDIPQSFIEFGVEDYRESNTRLLLQLRNWFGLVIDGSPAHVQDIQSQDVYWRHELIATCAFIDQENINTLIEDAGLRGEIGLLSIDIDGNDYWVWQAIDVVSPAIVVCEYNAVFGDIYPLSVPYDPAFQRTRAHHSNLYFGASLQAMITLGNRKGYTFVGTTSTGCNAFFVRNDYAQSVLGSLNKVLAYPSRIREHRDAENCLLYTGGLLRNRVIEKLPLINTETSTHTTLAQLKDIYSPQWHDFKRASL